MLCLKKRRTYSFTQGACKDAPRRWTKEKNAYNESVRVPLATLPRKNPNREELRRGSGGGMVLTVTEDTPADMLAGSMELVVQLPRDRAVHTQRVTVPRSTPMMDLLVQIATAHKLSASSYTLQAIGERGLVLPHQPNTPIGALDALQVKLLPKQGTFVPRKAKQANQPFETTFRLQVLLPRNQLYVSRVSPKMNLGKILEEVCGEKNLDKNKYELRHPANLEETLDLSLSLQDYQLQEVTLYAKQGRNMGAALSSQDIMALQRQEERRRQRAKQSVFGFMFRKSKESSLSIESLGGRRSVSPARSDETGRSVSPLAPPSRPQRKRRPAPKPPVRSRVSTENDGDDEDNDEDEDEGEDNDKVANDDNNNDESREKLVISHSRNSSDSSGYHEASVLSDNPDLSARMPETLPRRGKAPSKSETSRKLARMSQASKSLGNLATASGGLGHGISSTSISSTGTRKKRAAPPPPIARPLSSAISSQALERIVDSEESLTSDIDISKSPSDIAASSKANSDIGVHSMGSKPSSEIGYRIDAEFRAALADHEDASAEIEKRSAAVPPSASPKPSLRLEDRIPEPESTVVSSPLDNPKIPQMPRIIKRDSRALAPIPKPRNALGACAIEPPVATKRSVTVPKESDRRASNASELDETKEQTRAVGDKKWEAPNEPKSNGTMGSEDEEILQKRGLKYVKSLDDIYGLSMKFSKEETDEGASCAVVSTIPKCARITSDNARILNDEEHPEIVKSDASETRGSIERARKIFRSQSALNHFEAKSFEKANRHKTSHTEDFNCALNPNFSPSLVNREYAEKNKDTREEWTRRTGDEKIIGQDFPPFVASTTNLGFRRDATLAEDPDNRQPQFIEQSVGGEGPTETDILLQRVSDTLSNSLAPSASKPPLPRNIAAAAPPEAIREDPRSAKDESDGAGKRLEKGPSANGVPSLDATLNSQQDTSDYVSATGDDLSLTDWEYRLPAPPSAFRDDVSPDFDGYDTITLRSVEAFKEASVVGTPERQKIQSQSAVLPAREIAQIPTPLSIAESPLREDAETTPLEESPPRCDEKQKTNRQLSTESGKFEAASSILKREIISELSSRIENASLAQSSAKVSEHDGRRTTEQASAPKIAPVDNTLSNFTITTYSRHKSLDIFEEEARSMEKERENNRMKEDFSREKMSSVEKDERPEANESEEKNRSIQRGSLERDSSRSKGREKSANVYRSKSYITLTNNSKYREAADDERADKRSIESTSQTHFNLRKVAKNNEKFSQWRDNILKRQEEPSKEKQLQSIQVLKNILPRLKVDQRTEENVTDPSDDKGYSDCSRSECYAESESIESSSIVSEKKKGADAIEPRITTTTTTTTTTEDATAKRYKYTGPPAISLGSWSERPRVNVQLKMDTDYKFSTSNDNNTSGAKTRVNLNGATNDRGDYEKTKPTTLPRNFTKSFETTGGTVKPERPGDPTKTFLVHATAVGFKKASLNRVASVETNKSVEKNLDKPAVPSVAPEKALVESKSTESEDDSRIDSKPLNFRELSKTFGQEVCLGSRARRVPQNRHSDYYGARADVVENISRAINGQTSFRDIGSATRHSETARNQTSSRVESDGRETVKRFTSVVPLRNNRDNASENNDIFSRTRTASATINGLMPVVKGFKIPTSEKAGKRGESPVRENALPRVDLSKKIGAPPPPTMPVITGVTLKNNTARPKSMPIGKLDPRDQLLESIRNFGGRDGLKSVLVNES